MPVVVLRGCCPPLAGLGRTWVLTDCGVAGRLSQQQRLGRVQSGVTVL